MITKRFNKSSSVKESPYKIFDNLMEGCQVIDYDFKYFYVNDAVIRHARLTKEQLIGRPMIEVFPDLESSFVYRTVMQCMEDRKQRQIENEFRYQDGHSGWFELRVLPVDEGVLIFSLDITKRKQAENELQQNHEHLKLVLQGAQLGTWDWNYETGEVAFNDYWTEMLGYRLDEIEPSYQGWEKLVHPDDMPDVIEKLSAHLDNKVPVYETVHRLRHKSGEWVWVLAKGRVIHRDTNGRPMRVCGTHLDISARKHADEERRKLQTQLSNALEIAHLGHWEYDAADDFFTFNDQFYNIFKTAADQIGGYKMSFAEYADRFIHPEDRHLLDEIISKANESPDQHFSHQMDHRIIYADGTVGYITVHLFIIKDFLGKIIKIYGVNQDITERKKIEENLLNARKMDSIGNLAGGIAHDFNNILASVLGYTELALQKAEKGSDIEDDLNEIFTAGKRAKELVRQILTFARKSDEKMSPVHVRKILDEVLNLLRSSIPANIEIKNEIKSDSYVIANLTQLHQIIMNLCTNAAHAMEDDGGILSVNLRDYKISTRSESNKLDLKPGNYIELSVSDTGTGIPADIIESIFEPYFTTKKPEEGTGMGLAVVQGIIEKIGGKIKVESVQGNGTTFRVYLPVTEQTRLKHVNTHETLPGGTERILLIDDEPAITRISLRNLKNLGYSVTAKTGSPEALALFKSRPEYFDLVISDMTMPGLTGDKLAVELMKIRPDIPIIINTGYSKKFSEEEASKLGIKALIYKPIMRAELAKTVRKVLDEAVKPG